MLGGLVFNSKLEEEEGDHFTRREGSQVTWILLPFCLTDPTSTFTLHGLPTESRNNLCIHVASTFTSIIHMFDFWSENMLFQRCFSELCAVRVALRSQLGSD